MVATMPSMHDSKQSIQSSIAYSNNKETVVCAICSAHYIPSQAHTYLLKAPRLSLESAFMSMCHFCFRCRRPACPLCWDDVHGLCGACVEDVHLPFRQEVEPLPLNSALLVPALPRSQSRHMTSFPLICTQPGRFQTNAPSVEHGYVLEPVEVVSSTLDVQPQQEDYETSAQNEAIPVVAVQERKDVGGIARRIERVMTLVLGLILFVVAVLIVAASFSAQANEVIVHVLHVDIRMEIEYLLQLVQQLHSGG